MLFIICILANTIKSTFKHLTQCWHTPLS